jgi:hypothetical protein
MDNLCFISTWLPTINDSERQMITHWLTTFPVDQVTAEFTRYLLASPQSGYWDPTVLMGGLCCFYAGIGLYFAAGSVEPLGSRVDSLFALTSLYMLIDSYLDDATTPADDKRQLIQRLLQGLDDPSHITLGASNSLYKQIGQHITTLRSAAPAAIPALKRLVQLEVQSTVIQSQPNLDLTVYRQMAEAKGGATVQAMEALLGLPITPEGYELGVCFQLVDDLYDTRIDQADGIMTVSTFIYQRDGCADALLDEVIGRIHRLPGQFNLFKIGLLVMLMACVATEPIFSSAVMTHCQTYLPVQPDLRFGESLYQRLKRHHDQLKLGIISRYDTSFC